MFLEPKIRELLEELPGTSYGKALNKFLDEAKKELNDVESVETWEETVGRREALKIIKKLFDFMEEKKDTKKATNQYT